MNLSQAVVWLLQGGPNDRKHRGKAHPLVAILLHYSVAALVTVSVHDWLLFSRGERQNEGFYQWRNLHRRVGLFFAGYFVLYFSCRLALRWRPQERHDFCIEFYKQTFLCSVTIFHAALGFYTGRVALAQAYCIAVGIDQILWYIDLLGYFTCNKFIIGVTKYLFWPGTSWYSRLTSTHHLWTIPLVIWASNGVSDAVALPLSLVVVVSNVLLSRLLTPRSIAAEGDLRPAHYLNLNLAYELWPDIQVPFLFILEGKVPYLVRLFAFWSACNAIVFSLLQIISLQIIGPSIDYANCKS